MPCYHPQLAVRMPGKTQSGKHPLKFIGKASSYWNSSRRAPTHALLLPCRQCIGCRLEKSRQWATRLLHEIPYHDNACFLTLTYDDKHLPENQSLIKADLQTFFKNLRRRMDYYGKQKIKYFACGEYGDQTGRPHYHAALFGPFGCHTDDDGRELQEPSRSGDLQFTHDDISSVWPYGLHRFSELTFESAAYVARYVLKKVSGNAQEAHYGDRAPEFQTSSNGLGKSHLLGTPQAPELGWLRDVYPSDHVVLPGRGEFLPPPYYDRLLEKTDPALYESVKKARAEAHEKMTSSEWFEHVNRRLREGDVKKLVTEQTLIRGVL